MLESLSPQLVICVRVGARRQDHLLPYMADCRHTPDTLFFVAEEDFRLCRAHARWTPSKVAAQLAPQLAGFQEMPGEASISLEELYRARCALVPLVGEEEAGAFCESANPGVEVAATLGFYRRRRKPDAEEMKQVSEELEDLVKICTYASRQHAGGLVWLSWCGLSEKSKGRKTVPCHGSTLVAVTSWFAQKLLENFDILEFCHFDIALRNLLQSPPGDWFWCRASFVYPSIGHYCEHLSGCEEGLGWRQSEWTRSWVQDGTRRNPFDPTSRHRTLHKFSPSGVPPLLGTIILPESEGVDEEDLRWFTKDVDLESLSPHRSRQPGTASAVGAAAAQPSSGSRQQPPTGGQGPGGVNKRPAVQVSLTAEDPTRHGDNPAGQLLLTSRAKRQHRQHATNYRFRLFTQDEWKAPLVASPQDSAPPSACAALLRECSCA